MTTPNTKVYPPKIQDAADALSLKIGSKIDLYLVAGSGFRDAIPALDNQKTMPMSELRDFPSPSVSGHGSQFVWGNIGDKKILIATGRIHLYEGYSSDDVVFGVRMASALGANSVVLTNAAGSVDRKLPAGTLMVIKDQINLTGQNCESGPCKSQITFTDMMNCYDSEWRKKLMLQCNLPEGVYAGLMGPSYETMAEARMLALLGTHAVGMSTVQECIAARTLGLKVLGLSFITNMAGGLGGAIDHTDVLALASQGKHVIADALLHAIMLS